MMRMMVKRAWWTAGGLAILLLLPISGIALDRRPPIVADRFYANPEKSPMNTQGPNAFLVAMTPRLTPGKALDIAMGQGRNSLYLAQQGWQVTGFDISETGVMKAREEAARLGVQLDAHVQSAEAFDFGKERWDLVVVCYIDSRAWFDRIRESLKPGGMILLEYYHSDTRKMRPTLGNENKTFDTNELLYLFPGFRILYYEDVLDVPDWGFRRGEKEQLVRLLARKEVAQTPVECSWGKTLYGEGGEVCWHRKLLRCEEKGWKNSGLCADEPQKEDAGGTK